MRIFICLPKSKQQSRNSGDTHHFPDHQKKPLTKLIPRVSMSVRTLSHCLDAWITRCTQSTSVVDRISRFLDNSRTRVYGFPCFKFSAVHMSQWMPPESNPQPCIRRQQVIHHYSTECVSQKQVISAHRVDLGRHVVVYRAHRALQWCVTGR